MSPGLRSGQVAEAAGVNVQTLRYYERRGLLSEPERSNGGHRLYGEDAVTSLRVIKAAQRLGLTLDEVAELLEAGRHRHGRPSPVSRNRPWQSSPRSTRRSPTSPPPHRPGRRGRGRLRRLDRLRLQYLLPHPLRRPCRGEPPYRTLLLTPAPYHVLEALGAWPPRPAWCAARPGHSGRRRRRGGDGLAAVAVGLAVFAAGTRWLGRCRRAGRHGPRGHPSSGRGVHAGGGGSGGRGALTGTGVLGAAFLVLGFTVRLSQATPLPRCPSPRCSG